MARPSKLTPDQWVSKPTECIGAIADAFVRGSLSDDCYRMATLDKGLARCLHLKEFCAHDGFVDFDAYMAKKTLASGWSFVYILRGTHNARTVYKIGKANDVAARVKLFSVKIPFDIDPLAAFYVSDAYALEGALHKAMASTNVGGEWFNLTKRQLDTVFMLAASQEIFDYSGMMQICLREIEDSAKMSDADYIEYLESLLAMHGVSFSRKVV